jgi:hypothetical protein
LSELITRRKLITSGVVAAAGIGGIYAAARIADKYGFLAPDHQGILGNRNSRLGTAIACLADIVHENAR